MAPKRGKGVKQKISVSRLTIRNDDESGELATDDAPALEKADSGLEKERAQENNGVAAARKKRTAAAASTTADPRSGSEQPEEKKPSGTAAVRKKRAAAATTVMADSGSGDEESDEKKTSGTTAVRKKRTVLAPTVDADSGSGGEKPEEKKIGRAVAARKKRTLAATPMTADSESEYEQSGKKKTNRNAAAARKKRNLAATSTMADSGAGNEHPEEKTNGTAASRKKRAAAASAFAAPVSADSESVDEHPEEEKAKRNVKTCKKLAGAAAAASVMADSGSGSEQPTKMKTSGAAAGSKKRKIEKTGGEIKIITWNVAGLRAWVKKNGHALLAEEKPDIVAIQETKCTEVPEELKDGYHSFLDSAERSGHGGVLLLTKQEPIKVVCGFDDECDVDGKGKGRIIVAEFEKYYLINAYVPNSGRGLVNLEKRKIWDNYYLDFIKKLDSKKPVVYVGDLNVAHQEIDLANPKTNHNKTAGFTDQERNDFTRLLDAGFVDVFRKLNPEKEGAYTFWSNMHNAREKNVGWRLDYFVVSERLMDKVKDCDILSTVKGSDHCPLRLRIDL